ncbi:BrnA antitoxin family protein [Chromatium okenii]|jgi:predicted DNA binding CopG/RHH family protein|nr:BrnA antitoxin family protein [Chromatium okenii]
MSNNSDPLFVRYAEMDFADAQPVAAVPALAQLQAETVGKTCVTLLLENEVLASLKLRAEINGCHYQTLINEILIRAA